MRRRILIRTCAGLATNSLGAQVRRHAGLGLVWILFGLVGTALAADFEAAVPDPPDDFVGTAPVSNGSLVALQDGRLMMLGSGTHVSYSDDGGRTWSTAKSVETGGRPLQGAGDPTSLIRLKSGKLALLYGRGASAVGAPPGHNLFLRTSSDEGKTWSEEKQINVPGVTTSPYHDVLVQLESGRLVLPVRWLISGRYPEMAEAGAWGTFQGARYKVEGHAHWPEMDTTFVYYSDDKGQTWKSSATEVVIWHNDGVGGMWPCDESNIAQLNDGRLLMFMRTTLGRIYATTSDDKGVNWHLPQPTELAGSYSPCRLRRIPGTGDLLCVWNQVSAEEIRRGYRRGRLSLAISSDDGKTWKHFKTLFTSGGLEKRDRIEPEKEIGMVRARKDVGELPPDFGMAYYPNAHFIKDHVFITYGVRQGLRAQDGKVEFVSTQRQLLIRPVGWLYEP
jgi:sialidase-1